MAYDLISEEIKKFTPDKGFNLCAIDSHGMPGDSLSLIEHFDTLEEAKAAKAKTPGNTVIYP